MAAASKLLANMVYNYKGMGLSMVRALSGLQISLTFCDLTLKLIDTCSTNVGFSFHIVGQLYTT